MNLPTEAADDKAEKGMLADSGLTEASRSCGHPEQEWKKNLSYGVMWFLIFLGLGSCNYLADHDRAKPLIQIETK